MPDNSAEIEPIYHLDAQGRKERAGSHGSESSIQARALVSHSLIPAHLHQIKAWLGPLVHLAEQPLHLWLPENLGYLGWYQTNHRQHSRRLTCWLRLRRCSILDLRTLHIHDCIENPIPLSDG